MRSLILLFTLVACGGETTMSTEGYDQTCDIPEDCRVVFVGDVCGCACDVDAIRSTEYTLWSSERSSKANRCDELRDCAACPPITPTCEANTCGAELTSTTDTDASGG